MGESLQDLKGYFCHGEIQFLLTEVKTKMEGRGGEGERRGEGGAQDFNSF